MRDVLAFRDLIEAKVYQVLDGLLEFLSLFMRHQEQTREEGDKNEG